MASNNDDLLDSGNEFDGDEVEDTLEEGVEEGVEEGTEQEQAEGETEPTAKTSAKKSPKSTIPEQLRGNFSRKDAEEFRDKAALKGVVFLSRIPPYMKVSTIRKLFQAYGVDKIYLTPEAEGLRKHRKRMGGNKRRCYTEGWIEFTDKNQAKLVAMAFNNQKIGGKKGSFYYDDIWNIKYLPKFKWENLTEKIMYDNKVRDAKLKTELNMARKQHEFYVDQVEQSKRIMGIKKSKEKRQAEKSLDDDKEVKDAINEQNGGEVGKGRKDRLRRVFKQKQPKTNEAQETQE